MTRGRPPSPIQVQEHCGTWQIVHGQRVIAAYPTPTQAKFAARAVRRILRDTGSVPEVVKIEGFRRGMAL